MLAFASLWGGLSNRPACPPVTGTMCLHSWTAAWSPKTGGLALKGAGRDPRSFCCIRGARVRLCTVQWCPSTATRTGDTSLVWNYTVCVRRSVYWTGVCLSLSLGGGGQGHIHSSARRPTVDWSLLQTPDFKHIFETLVADSVCLNWRIESKSH